MLKWIWIPGWRIPVTLHDWGARTAQTTQSLSEVSASIYVDAPPSVVFETIADPEKPFTTANPLIDMTVVGDQTYGVGTVYRWTFNVPLGASLSLEEVVTEWVENERFAYRAISGWPMEAVNTLESEGGGTRLASTFRYRLPKPWCWLLPRRAVAVGVHGVVRNIRRYAEAEYRDRTLDATTLIEFDVNIDAPPAEVFRVAGDPRSKRVWVPAIKRVELLSDEVGLHTEYVASSGIGPVEFPFCERIVEWNPPTELGYAGTSRWGQFRSQWRLAPRDGGTRAYYRMDFWFGGGFVGRLFGAVITLVVRPWMSMRTARQVKNAVERSLWPIE